MALRLSDLVICGELDNSQNYAVRGWLRLRGCQRPLVLNLTGNPSADLMGKHFRFEVPERMHELVLEDLDDAETETASADFDALPDFLTNPDFDSELEGDLPPLAWQQIGPTGTMTAARRVKHLNGSPDDPADPGRRSETGSFEWKGSLYLEWFSQNGRVVLELVAPEIEYLDDADDDEDDEDDLFDIEHNHPHIPFGGADPLENLWGEEAFDADSPEFGDALYQDEDPYQLFSDELQELFDQNSYEIDRAILSDSERDEALSELELFDELLESGEGDPIGSLFDEPMRFPRPEQLNDDEVEAALKRLLGQLALFGIALDICKHFTPRDAYALLLDEICREEHAYPELRNTQWVQHFMTSEYCEECDAELEAEFAEEDDIQEWDDGPDDDVPF